jgi:hypothetical protein
MKNEINETPACKISIKRRINKTDYSQLTDEQRKSYWESFKMLCQGEDYEKEVSIREKEHRGDVILQNS